MVKFGYGLDIAEKRKIEHFHMFVREMAFQAFKTGLRKGEGRFMFKNNKKKILPPTEKSFIKYLFKIGYSQYDRGIDIRNEMNNFNKAQISLKKNNKKINEIVDFENSIDTLLRFKCILRDGIGVGTFQLIHKK